MADIFQKLQQGNGPINLFTLFQSAAVLHFFTRLLCHRINFFLLFLSPAVYFLSPFQSEKEEQALTLHTQMIPTMWQNSQILDVHCDFLAEHLLPPFDPICSDDSGEKTSSWTGAQMVKSCNTRSQDGVEEADKPQDSTITLSLTLIFHVCYTLVFNLPITK